MQITLKMYLEIVFTVNTPILNFLQVYLHVEIPRQPYVRLSQNQKSTLKLL